MKNLLLMLALAVPASAGTLEEAAADAAAPFEGLGAFAPAVVVDARPGPVPPALQAARPIGHKKTLDDAFMDGFGFVETPAVKILDRNMSCRTGLCEGNAAVGAFGYGLGVLLMPLAWVAGALTAGWWALFG